MNNRKVTMFIGVAGSTKSTSALDLIAESKTIVKPLSFADALRKYSFQLLNYTPENYVQAKTKIIFLDKLPMFVTTIVKKYFPFMPTLREVLEKMGDIGRVLAGESVWTTQLIEQIKNSNCDIVIDDGRFLDEIVKVRAYCKQNGINFKAIFCDLKSDKYQNFNSHNSAKLSQYLRDTLRLKHHEEIDDEIIESLIRNFK